MKPGAKWQLFVPPELAYSATPKPSIPGGSLLIFDVELLSVHEGAVRLRLQARGHGCGSTPQALKEIVENALYQGVPDMTSLEIEGAEEKQSFVPLGMLKGVA